METKITPKNAKNAETFICEKCDFVCHKKSDWTRHISTRKHTTVTFGDKMVTVCDKKTPEKNQYSCQKCQNEYQSRNGLWKHIQKCKPENKNDNNDENKIMYSNVMDKEELIIMLIKQNAELIKESTDFKSMMIEQQNKIMEQQNIVLEIAKNGTQNNNSYNTTNSHNKAFNLNFFLNETCKDALNIGEFVDSIKVQLTDLETIGRIGYVEGVSKILIKNLNELDTYSRPIYCSDSKREVLYIKENDQWTKETDDKLVLKNAIKQVANKNIRQITEWTNLNPDCKKSDSRKNDQYLKIVMNSMSGGSNEEQYNNVEKIIKNITKSVIIEK